MKSSLLRILALALLPSVSHALEIEVQVSDELGHPLSGAWVRVYWTPVPSPDPFNQPSIAQPTEAVTDGQGMAKLSGRHGLGRLRIDAGAAGYYVVSRSVDPRSISSAHLQLPLRGATVPARALDILTSALPADGEWRAFDFEVGAFLPPLGVGRHADILLRGRRGSADLPPGSRAPYRDWLELRFSEEGAGAFATPRPGQLGYPESLGASDGDCKVFGLGHPRSAPREGYLTELAFVEERLREAPPPGDVRWLQLNPDFVPGPAPAAAPQWVFRIRPRDGYRHGVLKAFGWLPDGRLRLTYVLAVEPGSVSLEFGGDSSLGR